MSRKKISTPVSDAQLAVMPTDTVTTEEAVRNESTVDERVTDDVPAIDSTTKSIHRISFLAQCALMGASDEVKQLCKCLKVEMPTDNFFETLLFAGQKRSFTTFHRIDPEVICVVCEGESIISTIEKELDALRKQTKKDKQKKFESIQKAILAKATPDAKLIDGKPQDTSSPQPPAKTSSTGEQPLDSEQLANERGLKLRKDETVYPDKHDKIKKAVYVSCTVALNQGTTKISKKAIFIDCVFVFTDGRFQNCRVHNTQI